MDKRKIVILSYYNYPCTHPVLENVFAKELGRDFDITWIFPGDTSKGKTIKWHNSRVLLIKKFEGDSWKVKILNKVAGWQRLFKLVTILLSGDTKIVLIRDIPLTGLLILPLRCLFKFKVFYQYSAPLGEINLALFRINKNIKRFWHFFLGIYLKSLNRQIIKRSDKVFTITDFYKKHLMAYTSPERLVSLTMGVDEEWMSRKRKDVSYLKKLKDEHLFLAYFGTLSFARDPKFILSIFELVNKVLPNCKLLLIGKTQNDWEDKQLHAFCHDLHIEKDVIFTGQIDRDNLQDHLQYCDLSISAIPSEEHYKISSPTKIYESLGNGVPVVGNKEILEQEKVISESGGGVLVDYNANSFSESIVTLLGDGSARKRMARDGKEYILKNYSYRVIAKNISPYFE